jgi:hypothetical protein
LAYDRNKLKELGVSLIVIFLFIFATLLPVVRRSEISIPIPMLLDEVSSFFSPFNFYYKSKYFLNYNWSYRVDSFEKGVYGSYYEPTFNASSWSKIEVPFLFRATKSNCSLWARTFFEVPDSMKTQKLRLIFLGVWETAKVWLNGIYLGEHVGYFSPFFFDIDGVVERNKTNVLVMYVESPIQNSFEDRSHATGVYGYSDFNQEVHYLPIGIWQDVILVGTGDATINIVLIKATDISERYATINFKLLFQNKQASDITIDLKLEILGPNNKTSYITIRTLELPKDEKKWETFEVVIQDPKIWDSVGIGKPNLYIANITLFTKDYVHGSISTIFGIRNVKGQFSYSQSVIEVNNKKIFLRGGSYFSPLFNLNQLNNRISQDLEELKGANINFLRSFAHVEPEYFFQYSSEKGFLVQLDFPLIGSYPKLDTSQLDKKMILKQLTEMILLSYNYPSIVIVCPHVLPGREIYTSPFYGTKVNQILDQELATLVESLDDNVILLPYSGVFDSFSCYGWSSGAWTEYIQYSPKVNMSLSNIISPISFPTETSPFWNISEKELSQELQRIFSTVSNNLTTDLPISIKEKIGLESTSPDAYFNLGKSNIVLSGDQSWELNGSGWVGTHTLQVVDANFSGYRFWGYYSHPWIGIGLAWSNDLIHWTKYKENPIISNGRWPSVVYLNGSFFMFYTFDYDKDSGIKLATSKDGVHFMDQKIIVKPEVGKRNQNPFIFKNPEDGKFYLYYYHGENKPPWIWEIRVRVANNLSELDKSQDLLVYSSSKTLAAPSVVYWNGKYYLTCETYEDDVWKTVAFYSDTPTSGFKECSNSPILSNDEACAMQYIINNTLVLFWSKLSGDKRTWDTRVAFSTIREYSIENISSGINVTQKYQALVLRTAIDRMRLLKFNLSIGISLFPLSDYVPTISGSLIDYYGFKKESYMTIKNAFNPLHSIIVVDGDFSSNSSFLYFYPGSTARIRIWVVNDIIEGKLDGFLNVKIRDATSNQTLFRESLKVKIPSFDSPAKLVYSKILELPYYLDKEHIIMVETELQLLNGTKVDNNSYVFGVKRGALVRLRTYNVANNTMKDSQSVLAFVGNRYQIIPLGNKMTNISVPANTKIIIYGPLLNEHDVYVPVNIDLGCLAEGEEKDAVIPLIPGAIVKVFALVPNILGNEIATQEMFVHLPSELLKNYSRLLLLNYTENESFLLELLNISPSTVVIPAGIDCFIQVNLITTDQINTLRLPNATEPLNLVKDSQLYLYTPLFTQVRSNQEVVIAAYNKSLAAVKEALSMGFYVGLEVEKIKQINETLRRLNYSRDPLQSLAYQADIMTLSSTIVSNIENILEEARMGIVLIFLIVMLISLAMSALLAKNKEQYGVLVIVSYLVLMVIAYQSFPGSSQISAYGELLIFLTIFFFAFVYFSVFIFQFLSSKVQTEEGLSFISAISVSIPYSIESLKKYKLRTILNLTSIIVITIALTSLTSINARYVGQVFLTKEFWPFNRPTVLMVQKSDGQPLTYTDLTFLSAQKEIKLISYKVENIPTINPLGYIKNIPIYGFRSISTSDPSLTNLSKYVSPPNALNIVLSESDAIIISKHVASELDININMSLEYAGIKLKVVGIYDENGVSELTEPDGSSWLPKRLGTIASEAPKPAPAAYLILTSPATAIKLGGEITGTYCVVRDKNQTDILARRLITLGDYAIIAAVPGDIVKKYCKGVFVEVVGFTVIVPIAIAILNIASVFYASVYERKREIFIFSAMGSNPVQIFTIFVAEASILGLLGGATGYILSMAIFKAFNVFDVVIPVNVKISATNMSIVVFFSVFISFISSGLPSLQASKIVTPSLVRKWRMEKSVVQDTTWKISTPFRISKEKIDAFVDFSFKRLQQYGSGLDVSITDVRKQKQEFSNKVNYILSFRYKHQPFSASVMAELREEREEYALCIIVIPTYQYPHRMVEGNVREIVSYFRKLVLEWTSTKGRIAFVLSNSLDPILTVVKAYQPQLAIIYTRRKDTEQLLKAFKSKVSSYGLYLPAVNIKRVEITDINLLVNNLAEELNDVDLICLDSDDGLLSMVVGLASIRLNKTVILIDSSGKINEVQSGKLLYWN